MRYSNSINSALKHDNNNGNSFYNLYYGTWNAGHNVAINFTLGFIFGGGSYDRSSITPSSAKPAPSDDN
jgi:hypothetical protein